MGVTFDFTGLVAGATADVSDITDNFNAINTYLTGTKLPNTELQNDSHSVCFSWHVGALTDGDTMDWRLRVPAGYSTGGLTLVECQLYVETCPTNQSVTAQIHNGTSASADTIMATPPQVTASAGFDSTTSFGANGFSGSFGSSDNIFVKLTEDGSTTGDLAGITVTLWCKAQHRS